MKLAILSGDPQLHSTRRLREAALTRGHEVQIVDHLRCVIDITSHRPAILDGGERLGEIDAVIAPSGRPTPSTAPPWSARSR